MRATITNAQDPRQTLSWQRPIRRLHEPNWIRWSGTGRGESQNVVRWSKKPPEPDPTVSFLQRLQQLCYKTRIVSLNCQPLFTSHISLTPHPVKIKHLLNLPGGTRNLVKMSMFEFIVKKLKISGRNASQQCWFTFIYFIHLLLQPAYYWIMILSPVLQVSPIGIDNTVRWALPSPQPGFWGSSCAYIADAHVFVVFRILYEYYYSFWLKRAQKFPNKVKTWKFNLVSGQ